MPARLRSGVLTALIVLVGSVGLWIGIPLLWLWVAGQIAGTGSTDRLGLALGVALFGAIASILAAGWVLSWLSNRRREVALARGEDDPGHFIVEVVVASSAMIAIVGFAAWFFLFAGTSPVPVNIRY